TLAARQLTQFVERCRTTSKADPTYCAIAAYRGSWDRLDIGFAEAVRTTVEEGSASNFELPKGTYFDANGIPFERTNPKLYVAPSTRMSQPDDRTRSWSSALFPTKSTTPNRTSAGEQNGDRTEDEPRLPGPAAVVPETSKAPIDSLFVSRSSEGGPNESLG